MFDWGEFYRMIQFQLLCLGIVELLILYNFIYMGVTI